MCLRVRESLRCLTASLLLVGLVCSPALAHYPWLTVLEEEPLSFEVGWGHDFPRDGILAVERIASAQVVAPDGTRRALELQPGEVHALESVADAGLYILALTQVPSYYSVTAEGGRRGSRADYPEALSCSQSANSMKALIARGGAEGDPALVVGQPLEILPLVDPASLAVGEELPVRVLFRGLPFQGSLDATWDGYAGPDEYALSLETDAEGQARIPLSASGLWLIKAAMQEPHPQPEFCDYQTYTSTLTFRLPSAPSNP
ncbi:DUF4198 domain-containing protein [Geoalkalibacter halelectricus]|uniref:DUF4198 domain-containing protein n=1 Tax=Geoalkalibacter halelectricus TaxID=2847045 RepID=A0ABY5ZI98_9BACT|nr:DUF4198 domain-containing protein [Geoalkalibacter halelectricus]MDO3377231.1 DUF4198 domain-containing protein [Geoalkalibacter halelectricus]UWZ78870.1 DUF4198 domain-containing protein [Geoalkalibacter halelectricus]